MTVLLRLSDAKSYINKITFIRTIRLTVYVEMNKVKIEVHLIGRQRVFPCMAVNSPSPEFESVDKDLYSKSYDQGW